VKEIDYEEGQGKMELSFDYGIVFVKTWRRIQELSEKVLFGVRRKRVLLEMVIERRILRWDRVRGGLFFQEIRVDCLR
jgi:hypothetical protein